MPLNRSLYSSASDLYETPKNLFDILNHVFEFTLDPAAKDSIESQKRIDTKLKYTQDDDGLSKSWDNESTFINPPYSKIKKWIEKAIQEYDERVYNASYKQIKPQPIVLLVPARTDTRWFHSIATHPYVKIIFIKGRLRFDKQKKSNAPFPSCLIILSPSSYLDRLWQYMMDTNPDHNIHVLASWIWSPKII